MAIEYSAIIKKKYAYKKTKAERKAKKADYHRKDFNNKK